MEFGIKPETIETVVLVASKPKLEKWTIADFKQNVQIVQGAIKHFENSNFVFFSSVDVYGTSPELPISESSALVGNTLYARSKIKSEEMLRDAFALEKLLIFRLPGVYGGHQKAHGLMDLFVRNIRTGQPIVLDSEEVLNVKRDWIYGPDIISLVIECIMKAKFTGGIVNPVSGNSISIHDWIRAAERITKSPSCISLRNPMVHHEIFDLIFDASKVQELFPHFNFTTVEHAHFSWTDA